MRAYEEIREARQLVTARTDELDDLKARHRTIMQDKDRLQRQVLVVFIMLTVLTMLVMLIMLIMFIMLIMLIMLVVLIMLFFAARYTR